MFESRFICICGLPGIGSVGKGSCGTSWQTSLECSRIEDFFSVQLSTQVMVSKGLAELMHSELMRPGTKEKLLILSGDAQPLDVVGMHELAGEILQASKSRSPQM